MKKSGFYQLVIVAFLCLLPNVLFAQNLTVEGTLFHFPIENRKVLPLTISLWSIKVLS